MAACSIGFGAMPGIEGVAAVSGLPPQRERNRFGTDIENYTPPPERSELVEYYQTVTSGYFEAMGIPIVQGRAFQATDRAGAPVAVVNEAFVRTFWKGLDPIGRRVRPRFGDQTPWVTVIGVAKDVKQAGVDTPDGHGTLLTARPAPANLPDHSRCSARQCVGRRQHATSCCGARCRQPRCSRRSPNAVREADPVAADHPVARHGGRRSGIRYAGPAC